MNPRPTRGRTGSLLIPGLEGVEFLPEPEDPRMLSTIDPDAPGYPAEAYGLSPDLDPGGWKEAEAAKPIKSPLDLPWGLWILLVVIVGLLVTYSTLVTYIEDFIPNSEWAYESTHIRELNEAGFDGSGVRVCIVDTGVDISHPDLSGVNLVGFKDFIDGTTGNPHDNDDEQSHGTMMVGILAANGSFRGASPGIQLIVAAALDSQGSSGSEATVADAIEWCWLEMGADIISLSLGGKPDMISTFGSRTELAVNSALDNGVFVVAAAGNHGGAGQDYPDVTVPANVKGVISVGATQRNGSLWSDSSAGSATNTDGSPRSWPNQKPEVVAPGVQIHSTFVSPEVGATWSRSDGTSDATVFVTGSLALILERYDGNPNLEPIQEGDRTPIELVKQALADSCEASTFQQAGSHHLRYGYGHLNAKAWSDEVGIRLAA